MVRLARLEVEGVRILSAVRLEPHERLNLVFGDNGAGKTSLLESIYLLGTGRSFRARETEKVLGWGCRELRVFGQVLDGVGSARLGVSRGGSGSVARLNGAEVRGFAPLARVLPLAVFSPESHELLGGGPEVRRGLMDWALFHVEPEYGEVLQRYRRALRQRNAALRGLAGRAEVGAWDRELAQQGERLDGWRRIYAEAAGELVRSLAPGGLLSRLALAYRRGWPAGTDLEGALQAGWETDRERGWTARGPHAADFALLLDGRPARDVASRGQVKVLAAALVLGNVAYVRQTNGRGPVVLADDVPSELDASARAWFLDRLHALGTQVFLTALDPAMVDLPDGIPHAVFHVERGRVVELV